MNPLKFLPILIVLILLTNGVEATTFFVNVNNPVPGAPYTNWLTAATNIQDAIDASSNGDVVLVTNGVYAFGGKVMAGDLINRVAISNAITVQSINGPWVTTILGAGATNGTAAVRCAWLTNGVSLIGFTLTGGATRNAGDSYALQSGGGAWCSSSNAYIKNCVILSNTANNYGGGVYQGRVGNSLITGNAGNYPNTGASQWSVLNNCTITSNSAVGVYYTWGMTNCIVYNNPRGNYSGGGNAAYCCTTPAFAGVGNFTTAPILAADNIHLLANSPCIGAGTNLVAGTDIFGISWSNPPSIGCAEWQPAPSVSAPQFQLATNPVGFFIGNAMILGAVPYNLAWLLNGSPLQDNGHFRFAQSSNLVATGILYSDAGNYQLVVSNSFGMATSAVAQVVIHCADAAGTNPVAPYTTWSNAATSIQDAINIAVPGEIVLATNGVYSTGGMVMAGDLTNRVALNKAVTVTSVNGYKSTVIQGAWDPIATNGPGAVRCVWLTNGAVLNGFTLQNGATRNTGNNSIGDPPQSGGGVWCNSTNGIVDDCLLTNNSAIYGGGMAYGTLNNSLVIANNAQFGGGVLYSTLNNCTVVNNYARFSGGGTYVAIVRNSIVVGNSGGNFYATGQPMYSYSCSSPSLPLGVGNTTVDPNFLDWFHISTLSPCRGTGNAAYASGFDMDGEPWNNPPSMGCDEVVVSNLVGSLSLNILATATNLLVNRYASFSGYITGRAAWENWAFGDGVMATNCVVNHKWTNSGDYTVTFTVYNNDNPTGVSTNVVVHVQPLTAPQIQSPVMLTNGFQFQFVGQATANYTIQYATNLVPPVSWQTLQFIFYSSGGVIPITDSAWTNTARFYRVLVQ